MDVRERIKVFVGTLPETVSIKAYGSSIGYQAGYKANEKKQVDLIVVVDDIKKFYKDNLKMNRYMYGFTPKLYFKFAKKDTLRKAARICYTADIKYGQDSFKMGVIEKRDVLDDLKNWETYYIAGRFQKEMYTVQANDEIEKANELNKRNALTVALVLLDKEAPTILDLYKTICSLSYMGDSRNNFKAEDPKKIEKLASGSKEYFDKEYTAKTNLFRIDKDGIIEIDYDKTLKSVINLPSELYNKIVVEVGHEKLEKEDLPIIRKVIVDYLTSIIKKSSMAQTMKGLKTTGPVKSLRYAFAKLKKGRKKA